MDLLPGSLSVWIRLAALPYRLHIDEKRLSHTGESSILRVHLERTSPYYAPFFTKNVI